MEKLTEQLRQAQTPTVKEKLQVLYWLKQEKPPSIITIAKAIGETSKYSADVVIDVS